VEVLTVIISTEMFRENLECHRRWGNIVDFSGAILMRRLERNLRFYG